MADALHLFVRSVHVVGMIVLVAGPAGVWYALRTSGPTAAALVRVERVLWIVTGVMVVTGVGNLGALGAPDPATRWGTVLTVKLLVVSLVVAGSMVRTFAVLRAARSPGRPPRDRLRRSYAATTAAFLLVVGLAEVLAHG